MKQLIVTADDYGVFPAINNGILDAVREKKINSVAVLANYDGNSTYASSTQNLEALLKVADGDTEIGCHLTITSGKPITDKVGFACDDKGYFLGYTGMHNYKAPEELAALKEELCEQVKRLESVAGFKVQHLTNHHNSLTLLPHHFNVYMEVARKFGIPMRSTLIRPEKRQNLYLRFLNYKLQNDIHAIDRDIIEKFSADIVNYFNANAAGVKSPQVLDSCHYGPISFLPAKPLELILIGQKRKKMNQLYKSFMEGTDTSLEFLLHLARPSGLTVDKSRGLDYPGIDRGYFDSRVVEYKSIMSYDLNKWEGVERKSWKYL